MGADTCSDFVDLPYMAGSQAGAAAKTSGHAGKSTACTTLGPADFLMQELGIAPSEEDRFGWIAEYGLNNDALPLSWSQHMDPESGQFYYLSEESRTTTWANPLTPCLRRIVHTGRLYLQQPTERFFDEQKVLLWFYHRQSLEGWCGPLSDDSGREYYFNYETGTSTWEDPRLDAQFMLELETLLISGLQAALPPAAVLLDGPQEMQVDEGLLQSSDNSQDSACAGASLDAGFRQSPKRAQSSCGSDKVSNLTLKAKAVDHKSALEKLACVVDRMHEINLEEEEVQRLQLSKKAAARKLRTAHSFARSGGARECDPPAACLDGANLPAVSLMSGDDEIQRARGPLYRLLEQRGLTNDRPLPHFGAHGLSLPTRIVEERARSKETPRLVDHDLMPAAVLGTRIRVGPPTRHATDLKDEAHKLRSPRPDRWPEQPREVVHVRPPPAADSKIELWTPENSLLDRGLMQPAADTNHELGEDDRLQVYLVDNTQLQAQTRGLSYRRSKNLPDKDGKSLAYWGTTVAGVDQGDGWLGVGGRFLPIAVDGIPVVVSYLSTSEL